VTDKLKQSIKRNTRRELSERELEDSARNLVGFIQLLIQADQEVKNKPILH